MRVNCMGGWCLVRDKCDHHRLNISVMVERLCKPNQTDAFVQFQPIQPQRITQPKGQ